MDDRYTYSEGDYCTCLRCGATVSTEIWWCDETSPVQIHDKWHELLEAR